MLEWAGLGWTELGRSGLGWSGLEWTRLGWAGVDWIGLEWAGLGWTGLDWTVVGWTGRNIVWTVLMVGLAGADRLYRQALLQFAPKMAADTDIQGTALQPIEF